MTNLLFQPLELAINTALASDPETAEKLGQFNDRAIHIDITDIKQSLTVRVEHDKIVLSGSSEESDLVIAASLLTLLKLKNDPDTLFSSEISIKGDVQFAKQLQDLMSGFDFDWEAQLAKILGDTLAYPIAHGIRSISSWLNNSKQSLTLNVVEYLQEEARMLPVDFQIQDYMNDIDRLRADCERLEARIMRLQGGSK